MKREESVHSYHSSQFVYDEATDSYRCPQGKDVVL